jgi:hypothetical protein
MNVSQNHKYLFAGLVVGVLLYWAWTRRAGAAEGG